MMAINSIIEEAKIAAAILPFFISSCKLILLRRILSIASSNKTLMTSVMSVKMRLSASERYVALKNSVSNGVILLIFRL